MIYSQLCIRVSRYEFVTQKLGEATFTVHRGHLNKKKKKPKHFLFTSFATYMQANIFEHTGENIREVISAIIFYFSKFK